MSRYRLRHSALPATLSGWIVLDDYFRPRFWATVWADVLLSGVEDGTRGTHLVGVEKLYQSASRQLGADRLDLILANGDFDNLEAVLGGFLVQLRNETAIDGVGREQAWQSAIRFVGDILRYLSPANGRRIGEVEANLHRLQTLYAQLAPRPAKPPAPIRALPAIVVEDMYEAFNPISPNNPFRTEASRWRNQLIFLLLLHLGLRRGEALMLPADAIKDDFDPATGEIRYWINIVETPYEDVDPRSAAPGLKTAYSRRQLPVSAEIVRLIDIYVENYRGRPGHPYLFNSQKNGPLATQTVADIFSAATAALPQRSQKALTDRLKHGVSPHDFRHTAALHRLGRYLAAGSPMDTAIDKLRVFFGWSPTSEMPRHYARAHFETSLAEIWNENFDTFVETLRSCTGEPA